MIVREIKDHRDEALKRLDWFNDYRDTRDWALDCCPVETVELLDKGYKRYLSDVFDIDPETNRHRGLKEE